MTVLVTVSAGEDLTRVRRYDGAAKGALLCTHEGWYDTGSVDPVSVASYHYRGAEQDKRGWRTGRDASWDSFGKQPA